jgi:hypothetical protein
VRSLQQLDADLSSVTPGADPCGAAEALLGIGEEVIEHWVVAREMKPTEELREGFRLLALHRQGAKGEAAFNACRETCRELVYYYNLVTMQTDHTDTSNRVEMMKLIASHLYLFVSGRMQVAELGDFCCSSKPIRQATDNAIANNKEN